MIDNTLLEAPVLELDGTGRMGRDAGALLVGQAAPVLHVLPGADDVDLRHGSLLSACGLAPRHRGEVIFASSVATPTMRSVVGPSPPLQRTVSGHSTSPQCTAW